ncbi:MAG: hypothetical protein JO154_10885 [Chitinophaga sp.]|uniref:DUF6794 domain-containing protein n=1 Tax=Chitinophaga sp. TaxID=1869181 RepID=UPI0025C32174|nr:DUF6794 domain-containing protein [Chitinophaga sp.]MBV8253102.1 hypothetical protein [Chitinophaga sp.]
MEIQYIPISHLYYLTMKSVILFLLLITTAMAACSQGMSDKERKYIPADLNECMQQLDKFVSDSDKVRYKEMPVYFFIGAMEQRYGSWIRQHWGLWKQSRLKSYFETFGISGPQDISKLIFQRYYHHLKGQQDEFGESMQYYMAHLEEVRVLDSIVKRQQLNKFRIGDTVIFSIKQDTRLFGAIVDRKDTANCQLKVILLDNGKSKWVDVWDIKK